jgi:HEAT repeat protein
MIRGAARSILAFALCGCLIPAPHDARAAARPYTDEGESRALIIGATNTSFETTEQDFRNLTQLLRSRYGFRSVEVVSGDQATTENVIKSIDGFFATSRPEDSIVLLILLPIALPQAGMEAVLVTADNPSGSYNGMPLFVLGKLILQARYRQALVVTPDCSFEFKGGRPLAEALMYSTTSTPTGFSRLSLLSYCPRVDSRAGSFSAPGLAGEFGQTLSTTREGTLLGAVELKDRLNASAREEVHFRLDLIPPVPGSGFVFRAGALVSTSPAEPDLPTGKTIEEWNTAVTSLAESARRNADNEPAAQRSVQILRDIALNEIPRRDVPSLSRQVAVTMLGTIRGASASAALSTIIGMAKDPFVRRAAITQLAQFGEPAEISAIRRALSDRDPGVQQSAIRALAARKDSEAADLISQLLEGQRLTNESKVVALQGIVAYSRPSDIALLARYLTDGRPEVTREALLGLRGEVAPEVAAQVMRLLHNDPDNSVRQEAAYALGRITVPNGDRGMTDRIGAELIDAAHRGPDDVTVAAFWAIGELNAVSATAAAALCDGVASASLSDRARAAAAEALGKLREGNCLPALHALSTGDANATLRASVITAVGYIGRQESVEPLTAAQADPDPDVARAAHDSLARIIQKNDVESLLKALEDDSRAIRTAAAVRLSHLTDANTVDKLLLALGDPKLRVRLGALSALAKNPEPRVTQRIVERLAADESTTIKPLLVNALKGRDFGQVSAALFNAAAHPDDSVRRAAANVLSSYLQEPTAVDCLTVLTVDPAASVRLPAVEALTSAQTRGSRSPQRLQSPAMMDTQAPPVCRPMPFLAWTGAKSSSYLPSRMGLVELATGNTAAIAPQMLEQPIKLDGRRYVEFDSSGQANADTGLSLHVSFQLDSVAGEQVLISKYDGVKASASWFLSIQDGRVRFGTIDQGTGGARVAVSDAAVTSPGKPAKVSATFNVPGQIMRIYVNGAEVPASLERGGQSEIVQIAQSTANIRVGAPFDDMTRPAPPSPLRGTVFGVAYYGWSLPTSYIVALYR